MFSPSNPRLEQWGCAVKLKLDVIASGDQTKGRTNKFFSALASTATARFCCESICHCVLRLATWQSFHRESHLRFRFMRVYISHFGHLLSHNTPLRSATMRDAPKYGRRWFSSFSSSETAMIIVRTIFYFRTEWNDCFDGLFIYLFARRRWLLLLLLLFGARVCVPAHGHIFDFSDALFSRCISFRTLYTYILDFFFLLFCWLDCSRTTVDLTIKSK